MIDHKLLFGNTRLSLHITRYKVFVIICKEGLADA